jgi:hypothetical protein
MMKMKQKKLKSGCERVDLSELDGFSFSNMGFFDKWIPDGCEIVQVQFCHEYGYYDEGDVAYIVIDWKEKE